MIITDVKSRVLYGEFKEPCGDSARPVWNARDIIIVEIETDEGITGQGFITGMNTCNGTEIYPTHEIIRRSLKSILVGRDPTMINGLWTEMFKTTTRFGRKGSAVRAISCVDIALWDLLGKIAGLPLYRLLGGCTNRVKGYASGGFFYPKDDMELVVEEMKDYVRRGFTAVKMKVGSPDIRYDVERVKRVRNAIGYGIDLMLDVNEGWDQRTAYWFIKQVADQDIYFLEEPVAPDNLVGYKELTAKSPIPIAAGENEYTKWGFRELICEHAVDIIQPDVTRLGGVTEWMKVAHMAEAYGVPCLTHCVSEIHVPLSAATPNSPMIEFVNPDHVANTLIVDVFPGPACTHEFRDGYIYCSEAPGLGLEVNWDVVEAHTVAVG